METKENEFKEVEVNGKIVINQNPKTGKLNLTIKLEVVE